MILNGGVARIFLGVLVLLLFARGDEGQADDAYHDGEEHELEGVVAVLFPWFVQVLGVLVFLVQTRFIVLFPYTAIMFIIGTFMGLGHSRLRNANYLSESIFVWINIDSETLLNVFLPGLIFADAFHLNVHLFRMAFWQLLDFAFPMVLAGTCLTALVAFYIFPYDWSWNLAMTFGSILSATDPVAVSSLLAELGAPPRLKIHISGESLLNDGAALVFFQIFSGLFYYEIGIGGSELTVGEGFAKFFRASLGGTAIGIGFGIGLVALLYFLDRRLSGEENVVQVAATITFAYLTFFVADVVAATSGVIAVVFCGVTAQAYGAKMINNEYMMESFWTLVEHLLNTVLFALGGAVWGEIIANPSYREGEFKARDWGYLFLLYVLIQVIRYFLMYAFYPITYNIGLSTNWRETFFQSFAGLRGAVGISLAISIDNTVIESTKNATYLTYTNTLFGMVGGIAFLTLVINGTLSGPVLKKLGLTDDSESRKKIVAKYKVKMDKFLLDEFIKLLSDPRYRKVDYEVVKNHVPGFADLTAAEFKEAVERHRRSTGADDYREPYVNNVLAYLETDPDSVITAANDEDPWNWVKDVYCSDGGIARSKTGNEEGEAEFFDPLPSEPREDIEEGAEMGEDEALPSEPQEDFEEGAKAGEAEAVKLNAKSSTSDVGTDSKLPADSQEQSAVLQTPSAIELRSAFLELLRSSYHSMIESGELDSRRGLIADNLLESLDWAQDSVRNGRALDDFGQWERLHRFWFDRGDRLVKKHLWWMSGGCSVQDRNVLERRYQQLRLEVYGALAFIKGHILAQERFADEFASGEFAAEEATIMRESKDEIIVAVNVLKSHDNDVVEDIVSHSLCIILMNKVAMYIEGLSAAGLLKPKEALAELEKIETILEILHSSSEVSTLESQGKSKKAD